MNDYLSGKTCIPDQHYSIRRKKVKKSDINDIVVLPLVSEVIKPLITIVGQISKFKFKYATGVRHSAIVEIEEY